MRHTVELNTVPESSEAHELAMSARGEVRYLFFAAVLLQPLVEALCDDDAALLLLHACPHAAIVDEGVVSAVDRLHLGSVVRVSLGPEGHESCHMLSAEVGSQMVGEADPIASTAACTSCRGRPHAGGHARDRLPGIPGRGSPGQSCSSGARCCRHRAPRRRAYASVGAGGGLGMASGWFVSCRIALTLKACAHQGQRITATHVAGEALSVGATAARW